MRTAIALCISLFALSARADVDPDTVAKIDKEREKAFADISKSHGDKKPSEMDNDERKQVIQEQQAAQAAILEKNGTDAKEYGRYSAKMNQDQREQAKRTRESMDAKEKADKDAASKPKEIVVEKGLPEGEED